MTREQGDAQLIHDRYCDLARVEGGFRAGKTGHPGLRPIYVQTREHTCGHVFVVMLSHLIRRELEQAWRAFDITVEEDLDLLSNLVVVPITLSPTCAIEKVAVPGEQSKKLLQALQIELPPVLPKSGVRAATRKKPPNRRESK